jgi:hypothetical protein
MIGAILIFLGIMFGFLSGGFARIKDKYGVLLSDTLWFVSFTISAACFLSAGYFLDTMK